MFAGVLIYTLYGYRKSHLGRGIVDLAVVPEDECIRSLEEGLDNAGFQHELAELGIGRLRRTQRSIGGHSYASARSRHKESFHSAREEDLHRQSFRSVKDDDERKFSFKSFTESFKSSRQPSLALQSISSGEPSSNSQRDARGVPDGRSSAVEALQRQGAYRDSFRSITSDASKSSFKSVRSDDEGWSSRGVTPSGRRSRFTSDSWKSASSGVSQRSTSSSRRQPGTARRVSPPNAAHQANIATISSRTTPAASSSTPPSSRRATPADLTRTPPSSRRTTAADLTRTPPQTPRGRGDVEILINPRRLCEELYQTSEPPIRTSTAPADLFSMPGPSRTPNGEPLQATVEEDTSPAKNNGNPGTNPDSYRVADSDVSSSSDSDSDSDGMERRRYSDADIEAASVLSIDGSERSESSSSSRDGRRTARTLPTASGSQANKRLTDLGLGDFAPVPRGKRSLSMSDISYDDDSDTASTIQQIHRPEEGKPRQPLAHKVEEEKPRSSPSPETTDNNVPRVHGIPLWTNNIDFLAQSSPKIAPQTQDPPHQPLPSVQRGDEIDMHAARDPNSHSSADSDTSSASATSQDENDHGSSQMVNDETRKTSREVPDLQATTVADGMIIQDLEDQIRDSGFHDKQGKVSRKSSDNSERKHINMPATAKNSTKSDMNEDSDRDSHRSSASDDVPPCSRDVEKELRIDGETDRDSSSSESDGGLLVPKANLDKSFSDNTDSDETSSGKHSRSGSDSAVSIEESQVVTHSGHLDASGSESESSSESSSETSIEAAVDGTDASSETESDSLPRRPVSAAAAASESLSDPDDCKEIMAALPDPANLGTEEPAEEQGDLRPVVRRQMRLPQVPAEARWLARTPTPPGLLTSLGVTNGPRLALERSASLPSLSSSSQSEGECEDGSLVPQRRSGHASDDSSSSRSVSVKAQSLPDVSDSSASEEESRLGHRGSQHNDEDSDASEGSSVPQMRSEPGTAKNESEEHFKAQEMRSESDSSGDSSEDDDSTAPVAVRRSRQVSESTEDGSPVPLRRKKPPLPRLAAVTDRTMSLKGATQPRSPVSRLDSLPPLNLGYRPIYRPAEQPSYALGAGRWQPAVQRARETFIQADSDDERAVSFVAVPLEQPVLSAESEGLQVRPELELLSRRLGGGRANGPGRPTASSTAPAPALAHDPATIPSVAPAASPVTPGFTADRRPSLTHQDDSPEVIFC